MTTIAADRSMMAADGKVSDGDIWFPGQKLYKFPDAIVGMAGAGRAMAQFLRWFKEGEPETVPERADDDGEFVALVLRHERFYVYVNDFWPEVINRPYHAIGSGAGPALMAMMLGNDPKRAVELTIDIDSNSGAPVSVLMLADLPKPKRKRKA